METLVEKAINKLGEKTPIQFDWQEINRKQEIGIDGYLNLLFNNENKQFKVLIKKNIRNIHLPDIYALGTNYQNFMIITDNFYPQIFKKLIEKNIGYLDTAGNVYIKTPHNLILIEGKKAKDDYGNNNKLFTPIGIKFTYYLLDDENFKYLNYREMAARVGTALGNINKIINKLVKEYYVIKQNNKLRINQPEELFKKWVDAYGKILKPQLFIGKYKFLQNDTVYNWQNINLTNETVWGGEPAANILTNYLKPAVFTIYTNEIKNDFIRNYRLVPDEKGIIQVYNKFWLINTENINYINTAPAMITYADLINTGDTRNIETAQMIYDGRIKEKLREV